MPFKDPIKGTRILPMKTPLKEVHALLVSNYFLAVVLSITFSLLLFLRASIQACPVWKWQEETLEMVSH